MAATISLTERIGETCHMNAHFLNKRLAYVLGLAGLVPFVLLTAGCALADSSMVGALINGQHAYGVAILSFLGGVHWGAAMMAPNLSMSQARNAMCWGVTPSIIAWASTAAGGYSFAALIVGFLLAYAIDKRLYAWYPMPPWFIHLRLLLTSVVVACLLLTVIIVNARS